VRLEDPIEVETAGAAAAPSRPEPTVSLRCGDCDHELVVGATPDECPECGGITLIRAAWHPFSALREFPGSGSR
jgi:hypothetical protein